MSVEFRQASFDHFTRGLLPMRTKITPVKRPKRNATKSEKKCTQHLKKFFAKLHRM